MLYLESITHSAPLNLTLSLFLANQPCSSSRGKEEEVDKEASVEKASSLISEKFSLRHKDGASSMTCI